MSRAHSVTPRVEVASRRYFLNKTWNKSAADPPTECYRMEAQMDEQIKIVEQKPLVAIILLGQASTATRGSTTMFPWFEPSPPPFDRRCLSC